MATIALAPKSGFRSALPSLLALTLAMTIGFAMMGSFGTVQESVKAELGLSDASLGAIQGVSAGLALVVFSIPVGLLVDRFNRVRLMIALALVWTLGTVLTAVSQGAVMLFIARVLTATGVTGALTAALSLTADLCLPAQRGRVGAAGRGHGLAVHRQPGAAGREHARNPRIPHDVRRRGCGGWGLDGRGAGDGGGVGLPSVIGRVGAV